MNLENVFSEHLTALCVMLGFVLACIIWVSVAVFGQRRAARKQREALLAEIEMEKARIGKLPRLNTRWLLKMPGVTSRPRMDGSEKPKPTRCFGSRYNRLIVFDEQGDEWVGLFMPGTLKSLRDGEYIQGDYFVPFRGPGEMLSGRPVIVDGLKIDIYPSWMSPESEAHNDADWKMWAEFERAFTEAFKTSNYQHVFRETFHSDWLREVTDKRHKFDALCARVTIATM